MTVFGFIGFLACFLLLFFGILKTGEILHGNADFVVRLLKRFFRTL